MAQLAPLQIEIVGREVVGGAEVELAFFLRRQRGLQAVRDRVREFGLNLEHITQLAVERARPELLIGARVDEFAGDTQLAGRPSDAAHENVGDVELVADLAGGFFGGAVVQHGRARDNPQIADAKQLREDVLMHPFRKKRVGLLVIAHVFEWEDRNRTVGRRVGRQKSSAHEQSQWHSEREGGGHGDPGSPRPAGGHRNRPRAEVDREWRDRGRVDQHPHAGDERRQLLRLAHADPLHVDERIRHVGVGLAGLVQCDRQDERLAFGHEVRSLLRQPPLEPEVALEPALRVAGNQRHEQGAVLDFAADFLIPRVAAAQFALIKPDLDPVGAEGRGNAFSRGRVFMGIAEENRTGARRCGFGLHGNGANPTAPRLRGQPKWAPHREERANRLGRAPAQA